MRILIIGGGGFLGTAIKHALSVDGHDIVTTHRNTSGSRDSFFCDIDKSRFSLFDKFDKFDVVLYLAWCSLERSNRNSLQHTEFRSRSQLFLEQAIKARVKKIVVAGTCDEYGLHEGICKEDQIVTPITQYGIEKNKLRIWLEEQCTESEIEFLWLRFFYLFGKKDIGASSIYNEISQNDSLHKGNYHLNTSGEQVRDYLPVHQAANLVAKTIPKAVGIFNIGSGIPTTLKDQISVWKEKNKWRINITYTDRILPIDEPKVQYADISKILFAITKVEFDESIRFP